jgi:hypothetical protein
VEVEGFPCRQSSFPFATKLRCRPFSENRRGRLRLSGLRERLDAYRDLHVDFDGFAFLEAEIELGFGFGFLLLNRLFVLHILEVVLEGDVEVEGVRSVLKVDGS